MGFWDVVAPAWTNMYREGELQRLEMGQKAGQIVQSPYMRSWLENNPDSALARSVAHIAGLPPGSGAGGDVGAQQGQTDMGSSQWQTPGRTPYQPPPPPPLADQPGQMGQAQIIQPQPSTPLPTPRLIGPAGQSAYRYPQPADTPENVSMEGTKATTALQEVERQLKEQQLRRMQQQGAGGGGARPGYTLEGYDLDQYGNVKTEHYKPSAPQGVTQLPEGVSLGQAGAGGGGVGVTGQGSGQTGGPPIPAQTPSPASIPNPQLDQDRQMFGLTPSQQAGQSQGTAPPQPSLAPGAPAPGATPPPGTPPGVPGAAPPGVQQVPVQTGVPGGTAPVAGPGAAPEGGAPQLTDVFGNPVTYTAPQTPPGGTGEAQQLRPGGPLMVEKPPATKQERRDMLTTLANHNWFVRQSIEKYGIDRATTIGGNSELIDAALAAKKAHERGAPSLAGQVSHLASSLNVVRYLGQPVQMPDTLPNGEKVDPKYAGKLVSPFTVLTDKAWYATFGERFGILGTMFGPGTVLANEAKKGDPRARKVRDYAGAVQGIVRGLGDVGNLSEGEQKIVADKLLPSENSSVYEAPGKQQDMLDLLGLIYRDLLAAQKGGGSNVDGANIARRYLQLPQIDQWSPGRDDDRHGVRPAANVIGAQPQAEPQTIGPAEGQM